MCPVTKIVGLYIYEHTHTKQPGSLSLHRSTPIAVLHAQTKEKPCGAQDRESIGGLVSVSKHHHTASHLSWDSTAPHQTKPQISLLQSSISLTSFFLHFIVFSCSYSPSVVLPVFLFVWLHQFI